MHVQSDFCINELSVLRSSKTVVSKAFVDRQDRNVGSKRSSNGHPSTYDLKLEECVTRCPHGTPHFR